MQQQLKIIQLFHSLLISGFHLSEIIDFLARSRLVKEAIIEKMRVGLVRGQDLSAILRSLSFSDAICSQVSLAESHGNLRQALERIQDYLLSVSRVKKKLIELSIYPLILLSFLLLIMMGLKNYLLPQLDQTSPLVSIINHFPTYFLGMALFLLILGLVGHYFYKKVSRLCLLSFLSKLPFIGSFYRDYYTAYFAREWGNLIGQGLELQEVVTIMSQQESPLFKELAASLEKGLLAGQSFERQVIQLPVFNHELGLIIEYGQVKDKLGEELSIYAKERWEQFFSRLHKVMQWIQPLVFLFVALMIVLIYVAMLLPIYSSLEF